MEPGQAATPTPQSTGSAPGTGSPDPAVPAVAVAPQQLPPTPQPQPQQPAEAAAAVATSTSTTTPSSSIISTTTTTTSSASTAQSAAAPSPPSLPAAPPAPSPSPSPLPPPAPTSTPTPTPTPTPTAAPATTTTATTTATTTTSSVGDNATPSSSSSTKGGEPAAPPQSHHRQQQPPPPPQQQAHSHHHHQAPPAHKGSGSSSSSGGGGGGGVGGTGGERGERRHSQSAHPSSATLSSSSHKASSSAPASSTATAAAPSVGKILPESKLNPKEDLICPQHYLNRLPDLPFDPKRLISSFDPNMFVKYHTTSLEKTYKRPLVCAPDVGVTIDLLDPHSLLNAHLTYNSPLDPEDAAICPPETPEIAQAKPKIPPSPSMITSSGGSSAASQKSKSAPHVTVEDQSRRQQPQAEKLDLDAKIRIIDDTFKAMENFNPVHPTDPHLTVEEVYTIVPTIAIPGVSYQQFVFDDDPATCDLPENDDEASAARTMLSHSELLETGRFPLMKTFTPETELPPSQQVGYLAHMVPATRTQTDPEVDEYSWVKEYQWKVKSVGTNIMIFVLGPPPPPLNMDKVMDPLITTEQMDETPLVVQYLGLSKKVEVSKVARTNLENLRQHPRPEKVVVHQCSMSGFV
ncbi:RNA polymerase II-associated factor 1 [Pelomyxa schiedti]|nr:RNA polymerase II-associated factor 1 [Pelomyxa schiedti]